MEQGKFPEAEQELNNALKLAEQFGEQDPRLIQSLTNLAILHNAKGEPEEAETLLSAES
jgi:Flp pilus assembly protein TadD